MKAPPTNLKVAAILEKANSIRLVRNWKFSLPTLEKTEVSMLCSMFKSMFLEQAVAGSDEDDDGDSWSDS